MLGSRVLHDPMLIWPQAVAKLNDEWPQAVAKNIIAKHPVSQILINAPQLVAQIPWGHNILIIQKLNDPADGLFYVQKTIENNWSRSVLTHQIESGLHLREGKAISNFVPLYRPPQSDLAHQMLRDPYQFDFLARTERYTERELENGLVAHLSGHAEQQVGRTLIEHLGELTHALFCGPATNVRLLAMA